MRVFLGSLLLCLFLVLPGCSSKSRAVHLSTPSEEATLRSHHRALQLDSILFAPSGGLPATYAPGMESPEAAPGLPVEDAALHCTYIVHAPTPVNTERYAVIDENPFEPVPSVPLSTFSIDVDTGSYSNMRRFVEGGQLPPRDAVRIEELINYFDYAYAPPEEDHPFAVHLATMPAPWKPAHRLVRIGLKGKEIAQEHRPPSNLVFLIDVSGSMTPEEKLPLLVRGMKLLVRQLDDRDTVGIVTYAGRSGVALAPTQCTREGRQQIVKVLDALGAGGSTHGSAGIQEAYRLAQRGYLIEGVNRVILCTDGDFNVGTTSLEQLIAIIEEKRNSGIFLTVLGFGMWNLKDETMEQLANKGNGMYGYIDNFSEARKMLVTQMMGSLVTIAKDVKIQVEFNPAEVAAWRLIGYENRLLADADFNDDLKDAGEIGAGHCVTALYELVPVGAPLPQDRTVDPLRYQQAPEQPLELTPAARSGELMTVKLRYKQPEGDTSTLMSVALPKAETGLEQADEETRFAAAVAGYGMLLRKSPHAGTLGYEEVIALARAAQGADEEGYRGEFLTLVRKARDLAGEE